MQKIKPISFLLQIGLIIAVLLINQGVLAQNLNGIAAIVNKQIITESQLQARVQLLKQQFNASQAQDLSPQHLRKQALDQLITEQLLQDKATQVGLSIDDTTLAQAIQHIAEQNRLSVDELKHKVTSQGLRYTDYQNMIRKQILMGKLMQGFLGSKIKVDQQAVNALVKKHAATHTNLYKLDDVIIDPAFKSLVPTVKRQLQSGGAMIKHGGITMHAIDWKTLDELPSLFEASLNHAQKGDVLGPINAPNGLHLLKVIDIKQRQTGPGVTEKQAEQIIYQQQFLKEQAKLLKKMRQEAYIKIMHTDAS